MPRQKVEASSAAETPKSRPKKRHYGASVSKMTSKGQVTISAGLRSALGLKPGDKVLISLWPDGTQATLERIMSFDELMASLPVRTVEPIDWKALREEMAEELAEKVFRDIESAGKRQELKDQKNATK